MADDDIRATTNMPPFPEGVVHTPTNFHEGDPIIGAAITEVIRLCNGERWRMTIPVDEEHDSDCILIGGLKQGEEHLITLDALRSAIETLATQYEAEATRHAAYSGDGVTDRDNQLIYQAERNARKTARELRGILAGASV